MKFLKPLTILVPLIIVLAALAAGMGLLYQTDGQPYTITNFRGETVTIQGHGLYQYDTVSSAAQMQANDLVTLVLGIPLLVFSFWLARKGSLRGQFLLSGTLAFYLYTYMSMSMNTAFNPLFLVYVALFGMSLYAFILSMLGYDVQSLPARFSDKLPRRAIAWVFIITAAFLTLAWVARILQPVMNGTPPLLENTTTMVIQAMDLVLIMPMAFLAAVLLLRRSAWGYLLASVASMKFITMGIAVSLMGINMARAGVPDSMALVGMFIIVTIANLILAALLLRAVLPSRQVKKQKAAFATKVQ